MTVSEETLKGAELRIPLPENWMRTWGCAAVDEAAGCELDPGGEVVCAELDPGDDPAGREPDPGDDPAGREPNPGDDPAGWEPDPDGDAGGAELDPDDEVPHAAITASPARPTTRPAVIRTMRLR